MTYSATVAAIFTVNLIVGVGSLTLSKGVNEAGIVLGPVIMAVFAFFSFVTATWVVELMATCNGLLAASGAAAEDEVDDADDTRNNEDSEFGVFAISRKVEFLEMSRLLLGPQRRLQRWLLNFCLISYLYGDLAIYAAAVPLSLVRVFGTGDGDAAADNNDQYMYRLFVLGFAALTVPFCFFSFQKTRVLQVITGAARQFALLLMIILAFQWWSRTSRLTGAAAASASASSSALIELPLARISGLRRMVGLTAYCFMVQHSLPSILTPVRDKRRLLRVLLFAFALVYTLYTLLVVSSNLAFGRETREHCPPAGRAGHARFVTCRVQQLVSLNFEGFSVTPIAVFLSLYVAFTLPFNLVMIAITLRNNLEAFLWGSGRRRARGAGWCCRPRVISTLLTTVPPFVVAFLTRDVEDLVSITGLGGLFIIFLGPARLIQVARRQSLRKHPNPHDSPFQSCVWPWLVLSLGAACFLLVISENIIHYV